jgi:hypothetical protein
VPLPYKLHVWKIVYHENYYTETSGVTDELKYFTKPCVTRDCGLQFPKKNIPLSENKSGIEFSVNNLLTLYHFLIHASTFLNPKTVKTLMF